MSTRRGPPAEVWPREISSVPSNSRPYVAARLRSEIPRRPRRLASETTSLPTASVSRPVRLMWLPNAMRS